MTLGHKHCLQDNDNLHTCTFEFCSLQMITLSKASMLYLCCWLESHRSFPRWESVLASLWHHIAGEHYCPKETWSWLPKSWLMVLHNCQVQHAERAHRPGSQVHCRSGTGPSKPPVCRPFWKAQSAWIFCSHRTRDCLGGLEMKRWDTLGSLIDWFIVSYRICTLHYFKTFLLITWMEETVGNSTVKWQDAWLIDM